MRARVCVCMCVLRYFDLVTERVAFAERLLQTEFLPHLGTGPDHATKKAYFVGYMVHKLLLTHLGRRPIDVCSADEWMRVYVCVCVRERERMCAYVSMVIVSSAILPRSDPFRLSGS
jgi:hypothetical protein